MILDFLYNLIVSPLVFIIECSFNLLYRALDNPGLAIIGVSLVVNVLCLPLYRMADAQQEEERERQADMASWVDHIKATFKGDEQYMMLTTYYRLVGYKPIYALRGSISLLLQIPFFIAAYTYLSHLPILADASFLFLSDLGSPDQLFTIGGFAINVMPVVMTLLNVGSTLVYTRGLPLRDKAQAYILALVFLVLLYDSPSGLVMYWTCNQLFSLLKNVFMKVLRHPREVITVIIEIAVVAGLVFLIAGHHLFSLKRIIFVVGVLVVLEAVLLKPYLLKDRELGLFDTGAWEGSTTPGFILSALLLSATVGLVAPSALITASPAEFINVNDFHNPLGSIVYATSVALGTFVLWVGTYYSLSRGEGRRAIACVTFVCSVCGIVDFLFFGRDLGNINSGLIFDNVPSYSRMQLLVNLLVLAVIAVALVLVWQKRHQLVVPVLAILLIGALGISVPNIVNIKATADEVSVEAARLVAEGNDRGGKEVEPIYTLSRTGQNVVVLFIDRAQSMYLPYILNERPDLAQTFEGFTYYPNTLSHGQCTIYGVAGLYGGYEYTPAAMNARHDELLVDKHNEALMVMPAMFSREGWYTDLNDPPFYQYGFSNVDYTPIEEQIPNVEAHHAEWMYTKTLSSEFAVIETELFTRNLFAYGLFKAAPLLIQPSIYSGGMYLNTTVNHALNKEFLGTYAMLTNLPGLTEVVDEPTNHLMLLENETTHMPDLLQLPNYEPALYIDNEGLVDPSWYVEDGQEMLMDEGTYVAHYQANMAALLRIGEWLDYLREQGCYDNTRIIIVSDHGWPIEQFPNYVFDNGNLPVQGYNPLFMVKDFDAHGDLATSNEFMTNADTPTIAMSGVVSDMTNPFTGNVISSDPKTEGDQVITTSANWHADWYVSDEGQYNSDGTYYDTSDGYWYAVHDDIFVEDNWTRVPEPR